jgi:outer membrane protein TolC
MRAREEDRLWAFLPQRSLTALEVVRTSLRVAKQQLHDADTQLITVQQEYKKARSAARRAAKVYFLRSKKPVGEPAPSTAEREMERTEEIFRAALKRLREVERDTDAAHELYRETRKTWFAERARHLKIAKTAAGSAASDDFM